MKVRESRGPSALGTARERVGPPPSTWSERVRKWWDRPSSVFAAHLG